MDWLRDKKNQPIVAAILAVVIVGAGVLLYFTVLQAPPPPPPPEPTPMGASEPMQPPTGSSEGAAPPPGMSATAAPTAAPTGVQPTGGAVVTATPMETWRPDPFLPVGYRPPATVKLKPRILDFPFIRLPPPPKPVKPELLPEPPQPIRRLAGVMLNGRVYAIIESQGQSRVYQPGEPLSDGMAVVERIEADKVILKTMKPPYRYLTVMLSSSPRPGTAAETTTPTTGAPTRIPGASSGPPMRPPTGGRSRGPYRMPTGGSSEGS